MPIKNQDVENINALASKGKKSKKQLEMEIRDLEKQMREAAKNLDFEKAAEIRDIVLELKAEL